MRPHCWHPRATTASSRGAIADHGVGADPERPVLGGGLDDRREPAPRRRSGSPGRARIHSGTGTPWARSTAFARSFRRHSASMSDDAPVRGIPRSSTRPAATGSPAAWLFSPSQRLNTSWKRPVASSADPLRRVAVELDQRPGRSRASASAATTGPGLPGAAGVPTDWAVASDWASVMTATRGRPRARAARPRRQCHVARRRPAGRPGSWARSPGRRPGRPWGSRSSWRGRAAPRAGGSPRGCAAPRARRTGRRCGPSRGSAGRDTRPSTVRSISPGERRGRAAAGHRKMASGRSGVSHSHLASYE